jgi:histone-lysine N-methyltransferase SETD2
VVITDREQALMNSLATSFPDAHRMLCVWHIQKNLLAKGAKLIAEDEQRKDMLQYWMNIVKISTRSDFQASFSRWAHKYGPDFEKYASSTWLPVAEHYSNAWTCTVPHFNNRTTSRMESAHAFIKSHLLGPQQTFTSAVQLISNAIEEQYHQITTLHFQQKITTLRYLGSIFRPCLGKITNYALGQAFNNLTEGKKLGPKSHCNQRYVQRMGIPCKHRLLEISQSGGTVSPDDFHLQWHMSVS